MFKIKKNDSKSSKRYLIVFLMLILINQIECHGRMDEPPSRNSAWRYGFRTPQNYNDCELNCGGAGRQHANNGGKCGICGDPFDVAIKPHEYGGIYATGTIVKSYSIGEFVKIGINITSNHLGTMEFKLCPLDNMRLEATQECLDQNILDIIGHGKKYNVAASDREIWLTVKLPEGISCEHCVLQWKYRGGNNWGSLPDGKNGLGIGPQEEFYNCADISIIATGQTEPITQVYTIESLITTSTVDELPVSESTTPPLLTIPAHRTSSTSSATTSTDDLIITLPSHKEQTTLSNNIVHVEPNGSNDIENTDEANATTSTLSTSTTTKSAKLRQKSKSGKKIKTTTTTSTTTITSIMTSTQTISTTSQVILNDKTSTKMNVFVITESQDQEEIARDEIVTPSIQKSTTPKTSTLSKKIRLMNNKSASSKTKLKHLKHRTSKLSTKTTTLTTTQEITTTTSVKRELPEQISTEFVEKLKPIMFGCGRLERPFKTRTVTQSPPYQGSLYCHLIGDTQISCKECYENCSTPLKKCPEKDCFCKWYS